MESGVNDWDIHLFDSEGSVEDKRDDYSSPSKRQKLEEGAEVEANYRRKRTCYHGDGGDHTEINKKFELEDGKRFANITITTEGN
jgi:hypothetical protein